MTQAPTVPQEDQARIVAPIWLIDEEVIQFADWIHPARIAPWHKVVFGLDGVRFAGLQRSTWQFYSDTNSQAFADNKPFTHPEINARVVGYIVKDKDGVHLNIGEFWIKVSERDVVQITKDEVRITWPSGMGIFAPIQPPLRYWVPNLDIKEQFVIKMFHEGFVSVCTTNETMSRGDAIRAIESDVGTTTFSLGFAPNLGYPAELTWPYRLTVRDILALD